MNANQLMSILSEYRPSTRLVVLVDGREVTGTSGPNSVLEMLSILMRIIDRGTGNPKREIAYLGKSNIIVRERTKHFTSPKAQPDLPLSPPFSDEWIELDVR